MNVSNFTLTEETMNRINKPLTYQEKGALRRKKLREIAESGKIKFAKNRKELANMMGFDPTKQGGYQWVGYNVKNGWLKETITGYTSEGYAEYEYEFIDKDKKQRVEPTVRTTQPPALPKPDKEVVPPADTDKPIVVTIYKGETTVAFENITAKMAAEIIKNILQ